MGKQQQRDKIARLISWGHWFTFANIIVSLAIGTLYLDAAEAPGSALGAIYMLISWIGHFAFLPFVFFIILIFPFCMLVPYPRVLRGIAALLASLGVIALIADAIFFRYYGYHLNTYSLSQLASDAEATFAGASFVIMLGLLLSFAVILAFEVVLANLAYKRLNDLQQRGLGAPVTTVFVLCFLASHSIHIWADGVFYKPITQQDDLFPVSYPTTAKTLMANHGLIDGQSYEARQEVISATQSIELDYPTAPMMCAKPATARTVNVVVFDYLPVDTALQLQQNENLDLTPAAVQLMGHPNVTQGAFQLTYSIADIYQNAINTAAQAPAYADVLDDFNIQYSLFSTAEFDPARLPETLQSRVSELPVSRATADAEPQLALNIIFADSADTAAVQAYLEQHRDEHLLVTAISAALPMASSDFDYALQRLQVPLLTSASLALENHAFANLTDVIPTALAPLIDCNDGLRPLSHGRNLAVAQRSYPRVVSFSPFIVIYDETLTTVLDNSGQIQVYGTQTNNRLENAEPPTPVLVDAIKELKRFSIDSKKEQRGAKN